jgi:Fur family transcriptional regulator, peroxide stress response regulator
MNRQEIAGKLREWGVRVTPQRLAIAETVLNSDDHPSVQQIYERVRDHFPSMTLATIYSTLDVLEKSGLIQELPFPQFSRYESNLEPHVNLVCVQCGNVIDANVGHEAVVRLKDQISSRTNFQVTGQRLDFHGWCRRCASEKQAQPSQV